MRRLSYSNVLSTVALFLALGGTTYAATNLPANSVGTKQLQKGAVTLSKVAKQTRSALHGAAGPQGPQGSPGLQGPKGDRGPVGPAGPAGSSTAYSFANYVGPSNQSNGSDHQVAQLALPAGAYVITAKTNLLPASGAGSGTVTCNLSGGPQADSETLAFDGNVTMNLQAAYDTFPATTVTLTCNSETSSWSASNTSLISTQVGSDHTS